MTEQTQPTDAEISACILAAKVKCVHPEAVTTIEIARAVLAKWGTPAGAGEPVGYINQGMAPHTKGKVVFHEKPTENLELRWWTPDQPVFTTPQPTQAQAGAVPLTPEQKHARNPYRHSRGAASIWLSGFAAAELWYRIGIKGADHG